jgi:hypothetical protein
MIIFRINPLFRTRALLVALFILALGLHLRAQGVDGPLPDAPEAHTATASPDDAPSIRNLPRNFLHDQEGIWASPFHIKAHDLKWILPLSAVTGAAIVTDRRALRDVVSLDPSFNNSNTNASNVMIGGMIAAPVVIYGFGHFRDDDHARETGILGAEAILDGLVVEQGMKLVFWRERPYMDGGRGKFFQTGAGVDSSFPSSHSVLAWSTAAVIANEYPNKLTQIGVYSAAAGISFTRLMGQQHFPSDLIVGSATGWLIGHYVYRHHHRHGVMDVAYSK